MAGKIIVSFVYFVILLASIAKFIFEGYTHQTLLILLCATFLTILILLKPEQRR